MPALVPCRRAANTRTSTPSSRPGPDRRTRCRGRSVPRRCCGCAGACSSAAWRRAVRPGVVTVVTVAADLVERRPSIARLSAPARPGRRHPTARRRRRRRNRDCPAASAGRATRRARSRSPRGPCLPLPRCIPIGALDDGDLATGIDGASARRMARRAMRSICCCHGATIVALPESPQFARLHECSTLADRLRRIRLFAGAPERVQLEAIAGRAITAPRSGR